MLIIDVKLSLCIYISIRVYIYMTNLWCSFYNVCILPIEDNGPYCLFCGVGLPNSENCCV